MNEYDNHIDKMLNSLENMYLDEGAEVSIDNFNFEGAITLEHNLIYAEIEVVISNGALVEITNINQVMILNREGEAIKIFGDSNELSVCRFLLWNTIGTENAIVKAAWKINTI